MTVWYKVDPNRFTYRELWRTSGRGLWPFAKAAWRKWLDIRLPPTSGFAIADSLEFVALDSLEDRPQTVFRSVIAAVEPHGFRFVFCHKGLFLGGVAYYIAVLIGADGATLASIEWLKDGVAERSTLALGSRTAARRLLTCSEPRGVDAPPEFDVWHLPGKSIGELIRIHSQRLDRLGRERVMPATEGEIAGRIIENQSLYRAYNLARGVYVPMTQEEIDLLRSVVMATAIAETGNPFQAPREDEPAVQRGTRPPISKRSLGVSICAGFFGGAMFGIILGLIALGDALDQGIPLWALLVGYFIVTPLFLGGAGALIALACWAGQQVFRRLVP